MGLDENKHCENGAVTCTALIWCVKFTKLGSFLCDTQLISIIDSWEINCRAKCTEARSVSNGSQSLIL